VGAAVDQVEIEHHAEFAFGAVDQDVELAVIDRGVGGGAGHTGIAMAAGGALVRQGNAVAW